VDTSILVAVIEEHAETNQEAGKHTDDHRRIRRDKSTRCGNRYQPCEHSIAGHRNVGFAKHQVPEDHGCRRAGDRGQVRVYGDARNPQVSRAERGARIKAHPAEEQNECSGDHEYQVVGGEDPNLSILLKLP
jgi:hypothetical protein